MIARLQSQYKGAEVSDWIQLLGFVLCLYVRCTWLFFKENLIYLWPVAESIDNEVKKSLLFNVSYRALLKYCKV